MEPEYNVGDMVIVDYSSLLSWKKRRLNSKEESRNGRLAIIVGHVKKKELGNFNEFHEVLRYEVFVGKEKIVVSGELLKRVPPQ